MNREGVVRKADRVATLLVRQQRGTITLDERLELEDTIWRCDAPTVREARDLAEQAQHVGDAQAVAA